MKHLSVTEKAEIHSIIMKWIGKLTKFNKERTIGSITMGEIFNLRKEITSEIITKFEDLLK